MALPWEAVTKAYLFEGPKGMQTLPEIFDGRSRLVVYHAMFDPSAASPSSSWTADAACRELLVLNRQLQRNRRPPEPPRRDHDRRIAGKLAAYQRRMGWTFPWYSSGDTECNFDN